MQENTAGSLRTDQSDPHIVIYVLFSGFRIPPTDINSFFFRGDSASRENAAVRLRGWRWL